MFMEKVSNNTDLLSRVQCQALKGIAILMIIIHNVAHWLPGAVPENEYTFDRGHTSMFFHELLHPDHNWLQIFSFLGHYGVPLFVFLSAYGLVKKYELRRNEPEPGKWDFIGKHFWKLFVLQLIGLVSLGLLLQVMPIFDARGDLTPSLQLAKNVTFLIPNSWWTHQASMFLNLDFLDHQSRFLLGPYWFFGFILQLYIIYRVFLYTRDHGSWRAKWAPLWFAVICFIVMLVGWLIGRHATLIYLRYNFLMGALPMAMGLYAGRYENRLPEVKYWQWFVALLLAIVSVPLMNWKLLLWFWAPAVVVVGGIALIRVLPGWLNRVFGAVGGISMMLFVVHPVVRMFFYCIDETAHPYRLMLIYLAISLISAIIYQWVYNRLSRIRFTRQKSRN